MYDVVVVGGGPAGTIAAMYLAKAGKKAVLLDKAVFPRDKTCGDAQGRKAAAILRELGVYEGYTKLPGQQIYGITLSSPNGTQVDVDVEQRDKPAPGYVHKRMDFDNYLFQCAKERTETRIFTVTEPILEDDYVKGVKGINEHGKQEEIRAKVVLAADGATSVLASRFGLNTNPHEHFIVAIRAYYKNVKELTDRIEIHLIKSLLPGYFWIFPLPDGEANVGLGMITKDMQNKKVNLKQAMLKEIEENPLFKERFSEAKLDGDIKGWNLPIASHHRKCFANGIIFLGDAASLIDPLSGEGVGNAMISGRVGAHIVLDALHRNDFSEQFLEKYDTLLWEAIGPEVEANYRLQRLGKKFPFLIDRLMMKAKKDESFRRKFEDLLPYTGGRKKIGQESFLQYLVEPGEKIELAPEED